MAIRFSVAMIAGLIVTLALFYLMQALIATGKSALTDDKLGTLVDFVRVKQEAELQTIDRKPKPPPPPDVPPPDVPPQKFNVNVDKTGYSMNTVSMDTAVKVTGGGFGISDGEYLPIVKVQPSYPQRALSRQLSGWALVEFTVTEAGTVRDAIVVENCGWVKGPRSEGECENSPNSVFDDAAVSAALKFKYKPKILDGDPVETAGVQNLIKFEMVDD